MNETRRGPVLVFGCAWLGDMVMSQCLLRALQAQGAGPIDLIASSWNAAAAALLPEVRELIVADFRHGVLDWGKRRRLGRELRAREYAAAYVLPNTLKSALVPFWARIPRRVGWRGEWRYGLLTDCYHPRHAPPHRARSFAALAHPPGAEFELLPPALRLDEARMAAFRDRHPDYASGEWIALCPGVARHPIKAWPAERYGQLADWLAGKGRKVALLGSKEDGKYAQAAVAASTSEPLDLTGRLPLDEVACLISCCQGIVSNDSGLMHLGAALGVPTLGIFGHTSPVNYRPLGEKAGYVEPEGGQRGMAAVKLEDVQARLEEILAG